jgi:hypothetical protein
MGNNLFQADQMFDWISFKSQTVNSVSFNITQICVLVTEISGEWVAIFSA